ncbi:metallophosphoesterase [Pseudovibrio exalbescens]|uniref:Calcineurin-like phosphoesterase domain-containing protein n=1 Tax=Pseudovibrio exalbescens TaxID=197461 RepID=A0A1U7JIT8_9HYPH|nr:metallophosphoesterase [Pseudovibrio exalbescens]OKL44615.1 hypothetical protein A3843_09580 [Pseudovibrio exalbescens]
MWIAIAIFILGLLVLAYAVLLEPFRDPVLRHFNVSLAGLCQPVRVVALGDLHASKPWMSPRRIRRIAHQVNRIKPDLVFLLGDFETGMHPPFCSSKAVSPEHWGPAIGSLHAPLGRYAVLGNHDWAEDLAGTRAILTSQQIKVLENEVRFVALSDGVGVWIAGLGDQYTNGKMFEGRERADDLPATLASIPADGNPAILLAHEPDIFDEVPERIGLILSGHTHGGQIRLPFWGAIMVPSRFGRRFAKGVFEKGSVKMIVTAGLGCSRLPIRFNCPPEVLLIDLVPANPEKPRH